MNELRIPDLFDLDASDGPLRNLLRGWRYPGAETAPTIRVDVSEKDDSYTVKADIPGVRKEDIDVRIDGSQVTISAQVKKESEQKEGDRVLRSERQFGYASRSFSLGSDIDDAKAQARYENGVLALSLPKKPTASKHRVQIS